MKTFTQILAIWALLVCLADLCCTKDFVTWGTKGTYELVNAKTAAKETEYKASPTLPRPAVTLCNTKEEQPEAMDRTGFAQVNIIKESVSTGTTRTKNIDKERRKQLREKRYRLSLDLVDSIPCNRNSLFKKALQNCQEYPVSAFATAFH